MNDELQFLMSFRFYLKLDLKAIILKSKFTEESYGHVGFPPYLKFVPIGQNDSEKKEKSCGFTVMIKLSQIKNIFLASLSNFKKLYLTDKLMIKWSTIVILIMHCFHFEQKKEITPPNYLTKKL